MFVPSMIPSLNSTCRVPFFFEPNFTALVQPSPAALRIHNSEKANENASVEGAYPPIVYGDFLKGKVGGNFTDESQPRERY